MEASHFSFFFIEKPCFFEGPCCCEASAFVCCAGDYALCHFLQTEHLPFDFLHSKEEKGAIHQLSLSG